MKFDTKTLCILAMMSTIAFLLGSFVRVPVVPLAPWLRYDPKDVIIIIAGFMYGPLAAFAITIVSSFLHLVTVSASGPLGFFMNVVSSTAFCCTAALIYQKKRTVKGAVLGLAVGVVFATAIMMMWNYIVVPYFMELPREDVVPLLIPAFLPYNLLSNTVNAALTMLVYKHVKKALQATRMMPKTPEASKSINWGVIVAAVFVLATCVLWWLILRGIIL